MSAWPDQPNEHPVPWSWVEVNDQIAPPSRAAIFDADEFVVTPPIAIATAMWLVKTVNGGLMSDKTRAYHDEHPFCEVSPCGIGGDVHHIRSRGAGGGDEESNLITLCRGHHSENHAMGWRRFAVKYGFEERYEAALGRTI